MKKEVQKRLMRLNGMTPERLNEMHTAADKEQWTARCWNCKQNTTAKRSDLTLCLHCGVNLWSRA